MFKQEIVVNPKEIVVNWRVTRPKIGIVTEHIRLVSCWVQAEGSPSTIIEKSEGQVIGAPMDLKKCRFYYQLIHFGWLMCHF